MGSPQKEHLPSHLLKGEIMLQDRSMSVVRIHEIDNISYETKAKVPFVMK